IGSCRATVSGSLLSRWQVSVVPERGSPVRTTSFSDIVPSEIPIEQFVEPVVVRRVELLQAPARCWLHLPVGAGVVDLELGRTPVGQAEKGKGPQQSFVRP